MTDQISPFKTQFCFEVPLTGPFAFEAGQVFDQMVMDNTKLVGHYPFGTVIADSASPNKIIVRSCDDSPDHEFIALYILELAEQKFVSGNFSFSYSHISSVLEPNDGFGGGIYLFDFERRFACRYDTQEIAKGHENVVFIPGYANARIVRDLGQIPDLSD